MKQTRLAGVFFSILTGLSLLVSACESQAEDRYVEVVGRAKVTVRPDVARIQAQIAATEESSKKALEAFLEKKGTFNTAVSPMNFEGIKVAFDKTRIAAPGMSAEVMGGGFGGDIAVDIEETASQISVAETVTIELPGLDKMEEDQVKRLIAKLYDEIKKNGGTPSGLAANQYGMWTGEQQSDITYALGNPEPLIEKGQLEAMDDARNRATHLAKLSGGKLGKVISVRETGPETGDDESMQQAMMQIYGMMTSADAFTVDTFGDIKFDVKLKVKFELED